MPDNFIWTKHIQERSQHRGISYNDVWLTLRSPDKTISQSGNKYKFFKNISGKEVVLVAAPQGSQWVILTTWVKDKASSHSHYTSRFGFSRDPLTMFVMNSLKRLFKK